MELTRSISEETNDFYGRLDAILLEGEIHQQEGKYSKAKKSLSEALTMSQEAGLYTNAIDLYRQLADVSHNLGEDTEAYKHFLRHSELKDSIFNVKKINEIANIEFSYQVDKKARIDSMNQVQADMLILELEEKKKYLAGRRNTLEYSGIALFVLIIIFLRDV